MSSTQTVQEVSTIEDLLVVGQEPQPQSIPGLGTISPGRLTASDLVVLKETPWRMEEKNGVVRPRVNHPPQEVVRRALAAALLANEEAGALRLWAVQSKELFGLFTSTTLCTARTGEAAQWPVGSLEHSVGRLSLTSVSEIIYSWAGQDSYHAWGDAGERIMGGMVNRRVLYREQVQKRVLKLFTITSEHYVLPDRTEAGVMPHSVQLLEGCQHVRPEFLRLMMREIDNGINRRQIHADYD